MTLWPAGSGHSGAHHGHSVLGSHGWIVLRIVPSRQLQGSSLFIRMLPVHWSILPTGVFTIGDYLFRSFQLELVDDLIDGTGGLRKVRFCDEQRGKGERL